MSIRLIDTKTLRMKWFQEGAIPAYAILSHTWENDQEVSFQEMTSIGETFRLWAHPAERKSGFLKIRKFCLRAKDKHYDYAWVDTCCIDKTSSAELTQQINSMYRWYSEAKECFVYLSDFLLEEQNLQEDQNFKKCRWFTRGWCLQELIAPQSITFFDRYWQDIGTKAGHKEVISKITRIDQRILDKSLSIASFSAAQKFSWAAKRVTSWPEDQAYCLLGIFNVNMPLLYGEGSKAFTRLQEEIIRKSNDLSIFEFHPKKQPATDLFAWSPTDLFAWSPTVFAGCGKVENMKDIFGRNEFTLTNNGLYFRRVELQIDDDLQTYQLRLQCTRSSEECFLLLRKFGPNMFVRWEYIDNKDDFEALEEVISEQLTQDMLSKEGSLSEQSTQDMLSKEGSLSEESTQDMLSEEGCLSEQSSQDMLSEEGSSPLDENEASNRSPSSKQSVVSDESRSLSRTSRVTNNGCLWGQSSTNRVAFVDEASHSDNEVVRDRRVEISEVYIITTVTPEVDDQIRFSDNNSIHIEWDNALGDVGWAIQDATPSELWDASRMIFLTMGRDSFEGYMKIYPSMTELRQNTQHSTLGEYHEGHIYLACGVDDILKEPSPWVRLHSEHDWGKFVQARGRMHGLKYLERPQMHENFTQDKISMRTIEISVRISSATEGGNIIFPIKMDFTDTGYEKKSNHKQRSLSRGRQRATSCR